MRPIVPLGARRLAAPAFIVLVVGALLAACSSPPAATSPAPPALSLPLATSVQGDGATWATVPMGDVDQPLNTFWQLLVRPDGSADWSNQVEATAVATNGGIAFAPAPTSLVAAVLPSQNLHFSPLVATSDAGQSWSNGVLDARLRALPDALAGGGTGDVFALVGTAADASVWRSGAGFDTWNVLARQSQLAASAGGRRCGLAELTALSELAGTAVVGGACHRPGTTGIFVEQPGGWQLGGPELPGALAQGRVEVLSVSSADDELTAVLAVSQRGGVDLVAAWSAPDGTWQVSPPLALSAGQLRSIGPDGTAGVFALSSAAGRNSVEIDGGPGSGWSALPAPPPGTATLAFVPGSAPQALAVHQSVLTVWSLGAGGWWRSQTLDVSIQYGSSS